jgi:hypothetical protein
MTTLFYDSFQNTNNWVGGNGYSTSIRVSADPLGKFDRVASFASTHERADTFSFVISSEFKSFTATFDYLGDATQTSNLGCFFSVSDGGSTSVITMAYAGAVKNANPPVYDTWFSGSSSSCCGPKGYYKQSSFVFLTDNSNWNHYSFSFTTNSQDLRIALGDYISANYPQSGSAGDCYFTNLLLTDSYGPSPFIATSTPDNFRSISVNALNQVADTVSYANSNAAVNINLGAKTSSGGYADGDVLNDIVNIIGSSYNDNLLGNDKDNTLTGGDGNDSLTAGKGSDILVGGNGNDKFIISSEITKATISDFNINDDLVDFRFFSSFYNLQTIINSSSYTNGNTVINLDNGKTLTLSGVNYSDLKDSNFLLTTLAPTFQPTFVPSLQPTLTPTFHPTFVPSLQPTLTPTSQPSFEPTLKPTSPTFTPTIFPTQNPTFSPTDLPSSYPSTFPTVSPTVKPSFVPTNLPSISPTFSPTSSPTGSPSFKPTHIPTELPTVIPTDIPTNTPTKSPTTHPTIKPTISFNPTCSPSIIPTSYSTNNEGFHEMDIDVPGTYNGTPIADKFLVTSPGEVAITGGEGVDKYTVFVNEGATLSIIDFDYTNEKIDLTDFVNMFSLKNLNPTSSGGFTLLDLGDGQKVKLKAVTQGSITDDNFIFVSHASTSNENNNTFLSSEAAIAIITAAGATFLGAYYFVYAAVNHIWPFVKHVESLENVYAEKIAGTVLDANVGYELVVKHDDI